MTEDEITELSRTAYMSMAEALRVAEDREDAMRMQADTDELTGLLNRRGLSRRVQARDWGFYVAADLNGFKAAQDAHPDGHEYGDTILAEFADFLMENTRQRDMRARDLLAARTGGDEFVLWTETRAGARRIKEAIREWVSKDGRVTASAGIGETPAAADAACFLDKNKKRASR